MSLTECPICLERFNRTEKMPKILSCGHTFCKNCLTKQKQKNNELFCSICREKQNVNDPEQLITNRTIYDLLYNPTNEDLDNDSIGSNFSTDSKEENLEFKVIMIGPAFSGKTSLVKRYVTQNFIDTYNVTVGLDFQSKTIHIGKKTVKIHIWDTAGTEMFQSLSRSYFRKCFAAIVVFDINEKKSFESLDTWINFYRENKERCLDDMLYLVGNKIDLNNPAVSDEEANSYLKENNLKKYFKTSAKSGDNVEKLFESIAKDLITNYKNQDFSQNEKNTIVLNGNNDDEDKKVKKGKCGC